METKMRQERVGRSFSGEFSVPKFAEFLSRLTHAIQEGITINEDNYKHKCIKSVIKDIGISRSPDNSYIYIDYEAEYIDRSEYQDKLDAQRQE